MRCATLALVGLLLFPLAAKADTIQVSITGSASGYSGTGVLTATRTGNTGGYTVTSITGSGITGLIAANDPTYGYGNNNLLYLNPAGLFDVNGLAFTGIFGSANVYLASLAQGYEVQGFDLSGTPFDSPVTLTLNSTTAVSPEPTSLVLSLTGLAGTLAAAYRRRLA